MKSLPRTGAMDWDSLTIGNEPWKRILDHSVGDYPKEACGILLCPRARPWRITDAFPTINVTSGESSTNYQVDPLKFLQVQRWAEERELAICGIYHSHPDFSAVPSELDRNFAWEGYLYLILSVKNGIFAESRAWRWDAVEERFEEVYSPTTM